jgi:hypothetical protein
LKGKFILIFEMVKSSVKRNKKAGLWSDPAPTLEPTGKPYDPQGKSQSQKSIHAMLSFKYHDPIFPAHEFIRLSESVNGKAYLKKNQFSNSKRY